MRISMIYTGLILSFLMWSLAGPASAQVARKNEVVSLKVGLQEMLQAHGAASLKKLSLNVDAEHAEMLRNQGVSASGAYTAYQGVDSDGGVVGTVIIVNERGKEGPFQVLVAVNPDGLVYDVGFTLFGEDKGKPALNWAFLNQFMDKNAGDFQSFEVDGVSGATWTTESVTSAIHRGAALFDIFLADG